MLDGGDGSGSDSDHADICKNPHIISWHKCYCLAMQNKKSTPCAYIITCRTYGTWLHGDSRTSVDRKHNVFLMPKIKANTSLQKDMHNLCKEETFIMDKQERSIVLIQLFKRVDRQTGLYIASST